MRRVMVLGIMTLVILAILPATAQGGSPVSPLASPVMLQKPAGLDSCPYAYIVNRYSIGYPTCATWAVLEFKLDIEPRYIAGCQLDWSEWWPELNDVCKPPELETKSPPPPIPTPIPSSCNRPGWWRASDWMGRIPMWTDGQSYCIEEGR